MQKRWIFNEDFDGDAINTLQQELNVSHTLAKLINQKGISSFNEAKSFFRPTLDQLHDPFLMKDMDKAVNRLTEAIANEESILVYGDYDVDGTTAVATFYGFLSKFYQKLEYYIPDRYKEGYGVSEDGIRYASQNGYSLIVTLDCGIKALEKVDLANELGIDVIICDHHTPGEETPNAYAVLDPKQVDCNYPYKELSGCGVGFKLLHGFCLQSGFEIEELYQFLDLMAVSIASDIVPITGENRVLAYFGLKKLNQSPRPGLKALIDLCKGNRDLTISGIVFGIGPRINAAGRMDHAGSAVALLLAKDEEEANLLADMVNTKNDVRRDFDNTITEEAIQMITTNDSLTHAKATVLYKEDWHKGVIGIVASRCIEKFYRPTVILTESNDKVTGSARSVDGFDVYAAISECSDLLEQFGGHMYAAGVTMSVDNVAAFQKKFQEVVARQITDEQLIPSLYIDTVIRLEEIDRKFFNVVNQMAPFGPQNMQPVFMTEQIQATNVKLLKEQHLKFTAKQEGTNVAYDAIGFGLGEYYDLVNCGLKFQMAFTVEENDFRGHKTLQLFVKDIKFDD
ncbi:single-stranded-DNA-specific exonuclease RecJ [uncultured Roseivirga sp.]|uniref:single-stranded-DNA-specific exonuclease RecJ n=1 Tax=uncultured Roseivirga sp. TaxID=543088 RepID=UPI000D7AB4DF|nr:single-stranded-DNA-specific exonuclease RecJ [uncultured Roseivirga sp.]PWL30662.1 MAG: single-stranded-DNA-specific exonuclease RecJ [Roseivirga sp. XM-24bin3]